MPQRMSEMWSDAPLGMAVYSPIYDEQGQLVDMRLDWFNEALTRLTKLNTHVIGQRLSEISPASFEHTLPKFAVLAATGRPFSYYRHYHNVEHDIDVDFLATAWTSHGMIAILIRDTNMDPVPLGDATDVDTALRLLDQRSRKTQELAELLMEQQQHSYFESL